MPLGKDKVAKRNSCFNRAHWAMAVGPLAPARMARRAMTTTLTKGCRRLMEERGSSSGSKCLTTSAKLTCRISAIVYSPCAKRRKSQGEGYTKKSVRAQVSKLPKLPKVRAGPGDQTCIDFNFLALGI